MEKMFNQMLKQMKELTEQLQQQNEQLETHGDGPFVSNQDILERVSTQKDRPRLLKKSQCLSFHE